MDPPEECFTHYSPMGATKLDQIYTTKELSTNKIDVETVAAAFTDHLAVIVRISLDFPIIRWTFWKMNTILDDEAFKEKLRQQWTIWRQQKRLFPDCRMWWGRYTNRKDSPFLHSARIRTPA